MGKTVLITGTSSGLGLATAKFFESKGWNVIATMRRLGKEADLLGLNKVFLVKLDVQDQVSIAQGIEAGIARFGKIDAVINNAGFGLSGVFEGIPQEKIREQFEVNVIGAMEVTRAILPHFRKNKEGMIINISSRAGIVGLPLTSLYCATKFALEGFSEALTYELSSQNIMVKIVAPGGGTSTNFGKRTNNEIAQNISIDDYDDFIAHIASVNATIAKLREDHQTSPEDVAEIIYNAATDGTDQFRYPVGHDIPSFMKARREMPEEGYIEFMRSWFQPKKKTG